ncbi:putative ribonuclease H-like domain-containing protein [Tanacetum coccineum]
MLRVFSITLTGAAKRWVDRLSLGTIDSWDILKKAFIQRYCPPSKTAKQLKNIRKFKQEGDETLYRAWEWYNDLLYKCTTHEINSHQKVNIFYSSLSTMNRQLLDSQGLIPGITRAQALTAIQTMADHSQKWHDGSSSRSINNNNSNTEGIAAIVSKLDSLGSPGYYTRIDNRPPFREKKPSLEELMNKHLEESTRRRTEMEKWMKKLQENAEINTQN